MSQCVVYINEYIFVKLKFAFGIARHSLKNKSSDKTYVLKPVCHGVYRKMRFLS